MANKMLIDAAHPEETRVVVLRGNRVEEFDFESENKKQLRGNIYLAKVTRVEPSLQAAFVDYGGNRHGFLAFSEIHPDYYQIPVGDRQALIEEDARAHREDDEEERPRRSRRNSRDRAKRHSRDEESVSGPAEDFEAEGAELQTAADLHPGDFGDDTGVFDGEETEAASAEAIEAEAVEARAEPQSAEAGSEAPTDATLAAIADVVVEGHPVESIEPEAGDDIEARSAEPVDQDEAEGEGEDNVEVIEARRAPDADDDADDEEEEGDDEAEHVEQLGGDAMEEMPMRPHRMRRQYKIQEVIKRRQVLLIQVVKEERGNKGAALTTYLSLAGRYSVLMPNTARGGGISRKITDATDRQRLKAIAQELEVPEGMGVILRTAGASRTKAEVKRDFEYLLRMWETVREMTLRSTAPTLVYEEGSLIKRAIRDLYNKDIDEVVVAGDNAYREAKEFMRMLMPSHAKNVQPYRDPQPIFAKAGAEAQLDAMFSNQVTLKSGGYIVINQTEALVAIDVNSGRSTREHNIEDTATRTNCEAADEIARQLRLRDLAGLIVVDFIDMEENRNNRTVERRLKEALKNDRARIQVGRISHFGLLEMSRQRIRTGVLEGSTVICPHCAGAGMIRSTSSIALHVLRITEDTLIRSAQYNITVKTRTVVALYILNQKRDNLRELEARFGVTITIMPDDSLSGMTYYAVERGELAAGLIEAQPGRDYVRADSIKPSELSAFDDDAEVEETEEETDEASASDEEGDGSGEKRRRRRRRRRSHNGEREASGISANAPQPSDEGLAVMAAEATSYAVATDPEAAGEAQEGEAPAGEGRRRRSRRRGRGGSRDVAQTEATSEAEFAESESGSEVIAIGEAEPVPADEPHRFAVTAEEAPVAEAPVAASAEVPAEVSAAAVEQSPPESAEPIQAASAPVEEAPVSSDPEPVAAQVAPEPEPSVPAEPPRPKKTGWWQRAKATLGG